MTGSESSVGAVPAEFAPDPAAALSDLAVDLRAEGTLIAEHVAEPRVEPVFGMLVAAGPRCVATAGAHAAVIESVREGYLCHYGEPRLLSSLDPDLRLLLGDHLYARGIERLAELGDLLAVAELADLIALVAQLDEGAEDASADREAIWLATAVAIAAGPGDGHADAKQAVRDGHSPRLLWQQACERAERTDISGPLARAADAVGFRPLDLG